MMRLALLVVAVGLVSSSTARGDGPCDVEAAAVRGKRDPSLAPPTDPEAVARMKSGNNHHREGLKRAAVVATRDEAAGEFRAAIDDYVAAAMASPSPSVLFNLAQTYRAAGDYASAIAQYQLFLNRAKPGARLRKLVECQIGAMTAELARAASTAAPRGPGHEDDPNRPADASPTEGATESAPAPLGRPLELPPPPPPPRAAPWHGDAIGWTLAGGGVAVAGLGAFFLVDARNLRSEADDESRDDVREELRDRADTRQTWGTITAVAGAALLTVAVVKLAITPDAPRPRLAVHVAPGSIAVAGWF